MPRSDQLSAEELEVVCALSLAEITQSEIAKHTKKSRKAEYNCLESSESRRAAHRCGRPRSLRQRSAEATQRGFKQDQKLKAAP